MNKKDRLLKRTLENRSYASIKDKNISFQQCKRKTYNLRTFGQEISNVQRHVIERGSSRRRKASGTFLSLPLALKRKKSLNELYK